MIETLAEALQGIGRYRQRALATGFGVFWGVFIVTVLQAGGEGLRQGLASLYKDSAHGLVWVWSDRTSKSQNGLAAGRSVPLRVGDLDALAKNVPELQNLSPRYPAPRSTLVAHGVRAGHPSVFGVYPAYAVPEQLFLVRGRWLNQLDVREARRVAVVGVAALAMLFGAEEPVGSEISIAGTPYRVVGISDDPGGGMETERVYVPYSAIASQLGADGRVTTIVATLADDAEVGPTRHKLESLLSRRHSTSPEDRSAVGAWFAAEQYRRLQALMRGITLAVAIVGLGTLFSGMVGVSNILFVTVRERAQEFGIRRALGGTAFSIVRLVLTEACLLSLVAGSLGLLSAFGAVHLAQQAGLETDYFRQPHIDVAQTLVTFGALVGSALLAGLFPAREAARMQPVEALNRA